MQSEKSFKLRKRAKMKGSTIFWVQVLKGFNFASRFLRIGLSMEI